MSQPPGTFQARQCAFPSRSPRYTLNGVRSPHSLRAYGYDVVVWVRFLAQACGKTVWSVEREDVAAFHRARRRENAGFRISAASWNRSVASLEKLYRWAELGGAGRIRAVHPPRCL